MAKTSALRVIQLLKMAKKRHQDNKLSDTEEYDVREICDLHLSGKYKCYKILQFLEKWTIKVVI
jgi:hypothetical protein